MVSEPQRLVPEKELAMILVRRDPLRQILIDARPRSHGIRLIFEVPLDNHIGRLVSLLSAFLAVGLVVLGWRAREAA